jgi:DNA-directed RNA polymerase sigma subunit (sigma70/sigma32)
MSLRAIGEEMHLTKERVRQIQRSAEKKLKLRSRSLLVQMVQATEHEFAYAIDED